MSSASLCVTSWYSARPRLPATSGCSHDISDLQPSLGVALEAFILEHEYCGELDGGVEGDHVLMTCTCGAVINRDADRD